MNRLIYFLCVSISITSISFFSVGFAEFTLFHAFLGIFLAYLAARDLQRKSTDTKVPASLLVLIVYISVSNLFISDTFKVTSYIYSVIIVMELIVLVKISRNLELNDIVKIVKTIILLFFMSIVIESLFILLNVVPVGVWSRIFPIYDFADQIRPMGLSNEPSYAAITLVFAVYVLLRCDNFTFKANEVKWYLLAIIAIFLSRSTYGYALVSLLIVFLIIKGRVLSVILKFILKNPAVGILLSLVIFIMSFLILINLDNKPFQRLFKIYETLSETGFNITGLLDIAYVDSSAGMRIVPTLQLIEYFSYADLKFILFGNGAGQSTVFYSSLWGQLTQVGFIPAFVYNYGIIGTLVCFFCFKFFFPRKGLFLNILVFLFLFNADLNTQIFVYILFTVMMVARLEKLTFHQSKLTEMNLKKV